MSHLEETFYLQIRALRLPDLEREYRFHPVRKWRFDFALVKQKIAVEIDGGTWSGGRHTRGKGFQNDCNKLNSAATLGWLVLRGDSKMVKSGELVRDFEAILKAQGARYGN